MGIHEYLESHDVCASDVPQFLLMHTVLSAALVGSTWWLCYYAAGNMIEMASSSLPSWVAAMPQEPKPKSLLLNSVMFSSMVPNGIKRKLYQGLVSVEKGSRNSRAVKYLGRKFPALDATRVCVSYAEAKLGRLVVKPITVPGRIWLSWKAIKVLKHPSDLSSQNQSHRKIVK